jgi:hypothetical protein
MEVIEAEENRNGTKDGQLTRREVYECRIETMENKRMFTEHKIGELIESTKYNELGIPVTTSMCFIRTQHELVVK